MQVGGDGESEIHEFPVQCFGKKDCISVISISKVFIDFKFYFLK